MLLKIKNYFRKPAIAFDEVKSPAAAYDLWANQYDKQPDNLVLAFEASLFGRFLDTMPIDSADIVDVGCGTGRHWSSILNKKPGSLQGFDVSGGMLSQLRLKFPDAQVVQQTNHQLAGLMDQSCDIVLSTLTLAHMENADLILREWNRVLRPGGRILITDFHPNALHNGSQRTFRHGKHLFAVESYAHPIESLCEIARKLNFDIVTFEEKYIDETARPYYEKQNAIATYKRFFGLPLLYALHLKKNS